MKGTPRRKNETHQVRGEAFTQIVLEVTLAQLAEVGYERLSIPAVAAIAGVNKTSIYRRWPGKADLVRDSLGAAMRHADQPADTGDLRGDLVGLAQSVAAFTRSPAGTSIIRILLAEGGNPTVSTLAQSAYGETSRHGPLEFIERAGARACLRDGIDPSLVLFTIAGAIVHRVFIERRVATQDFIEEVVDLVLLGAQAQARR
jgi:AcrR family transcriptional regulator